MLTIGMTKYAVSSALSKPPFSFNHQALSNTLPFRKHYLSSGLEPIAAEIKLKHWTHCWNIIENEDSFMCAMTKQLLFHNRIFIFLKSVNFLHFDLFMTKFLH